MAGVAENCFTTVMRHDKMVQQGMTTWLSDYDTDTQKGRLRKILDTLSTNQPLHVSGPAFHRFDLGPSRSQFVVRSFIITSHDRDLYHDEYQYLQKCNAPCISTCTCHSSHVCHLTLHKSSSVTWWDFWGAFNSRKIRSYELQHILKTFLCFLLSKDTN